MKNYLLAILIVAMLAISTAMAQPAANLQAKIKTLGVLGEGLAVSAGNPADFKVIRMGLAKVTIAGTDFDAGVLFLDSDKYAVKDFRHGNGTANGDIYLNSTKVGSFSLNLVPKPGRDVWYGSLTVSGASYNAYIVAAQRAIKATEAADNIRDFCKDNPAKCGVVARAIKGIGNTCANLNSTNCRDKIVDYCEKNPTDARCVSVFREYCAKHTDDSRCVTELKLFCSKNPTNSKCVQFCQKLPKACAIAKTAMPVKTVTDAATVAQETNSTETETGTTISASAR